MNPQLRSSAERRAPPRVLLVDVDRKMTRLLSDYLEANGFKVGIAADGSAGLACATAEPWDLVILDVMLPNLDGFQVLRALRQSSRVPVLMLTARGAEEDRINGLDHGADDYLPKTASARELLARIRAVLRRAELSRAPAPALAPAEVLVSGDLRILPAARRAELAGVRLQLTPVEYDLLETLARHRGKVRTRDQLLDQVRDREYDVLDRSIDVHVASLRRKLGDDPRAPRYIRTVRTAGYLLIDPEHEPPA
jgi:DNA-binding response OmpR family regulator